MSVLALSSVAAQATGGGANGTVQVAGRGLAEDPGSAGHVPCEFDIRFAGFDDVSAIDRMVITYKDNATLVVYDSDPDDAVDIVNEFDDGVYVHQLSAADLDLAAGTTHHVTLATELHGSDVEVKSKVFWIDCEATTTIDDTTIDDTTIDDTTIDDTTIDDTTTDDTTTDDTTTDDTTIDDTTTDDTTTDDTTTDDTDDGAIVIESANPSPLPADPSPAPIVTPPPAPAPAAPAASAPAPAPAAQLSPAPPRDGSSITGASGRPAGVLPSVIHDDRPSATIPTLAATGSDLGGVAALGASLIALGASLLVVFGRRRPAVVVS